jgi:hypothetical protein
MKKLNPPGTFTFLIALLFISSSVVKAQVSVLTQHNDLKRTGWNSNEKTLNQNNVNTSSFGKIFTRIVDDQIFSQPLVIPNLNINGKVRNVVFVTTVSNGVYAFDADDPNANAYLWKMNITKTGYRPVSKYDMPEACGGIYTDFSNNMGIVGTPVIDTSTNTLYVVARSVTKTTPLNFVQYLLAIDIKTGTYKPNGWVQITATVNGNGWGSVNGKITFDSKWQNQRSALLLYNGVVYIAWAGHCDTGPYHGWLIGYDAKTLQQKYVYMNTAESAQGGIWMSGQAPSVDDNGFIYLTTGNGKVGVNGDPNDLVNRGESLLKLSTTSGNLKIVDFFTPSNYKRLDTLDQDYGSDGVLLIPNTTLSISGSKEGISYLVNTGKMGKYSANDSGIVQKIIIGKSPKDVHPIPFPNIHGTPVYFRNSNGQEYIYAWAEYNLLKQIPFNRTTLKFDTARMINGTTILPNGMPGAMLSASSNGQTAGTGILWATHPLQGDALRAVVPGILQAFDAGNVSRELWNSNMVPARDSIGRFAKFVCPTIANGKVYMATFSNQLVVYGLLPARSVIAKTANAASSTISSEAKLTISPNPAQRQVTIEYEDSKAVASEKARVDIFGSAGNLIYSKEVVTNTGGSVYLKVNLPSSIRNGVYTVRITNAKGAYKVEKLVISN